ncbi:MAG TPA: hypothetical protein VKN63_01735 [Afifellaceae bacterium]|nr:hypothetical protein [Afifellaceae bacterium]
MTALAPCDDRRLVRADRPGSASSAGGRVIIEYRKPVWHGR